MLQVTIKELRKTLATLYQDEDQARAFIGFGFTTLKPELLDFRGSAIVMWTKILTEAMKHGNGIDEIVSNAFDEYGEENEVIQTALNEGVIYEKAKKTIEEKYIPFKNILNRINKDGFGEIRRVDCNRSEQVKQYDNSMGSSCTITFVFGNAKDKPNSFAERIMLRTLEDSKDVDTGKHNCWLYRNPNGDKRVDEIPFDIRSKLDVSKKNFCTKMESLFGGLDMDNAKEYFAHQNFKDFSLSLNYDYSLGDEILVPFTSWVYDTFSGIKETNFQIFFILRGFQSIDSNQTKIDQIIKSLGSVPVVPIKVSKPVNEIDIQTWKSKINVEMYSQEEFLTDLKYLNVSEAEIKEFKDTKKISMQVMEIFQNNLYDAFHKIHRSNEQQ